MSFRIPLELPTFSKTEVQRDKSGAGVINRLMWHRVVLFYEKHLEN